MVTSASVVQELSKNVQHKKYGDDLNVMNTENCVLDVDRNCSLNSFDQICDIHRPKNGTEFVENMQVLEVGFIPKGPLKLFTGTPVWWDSPLDIFQAHFRIKQSGLPIYLGCRIPVVSNLKCQNWRLYLKSYWVKQLIDLLTNVQLISTDKNHESAVKNCTHVEKYDGITRL